MKNLKNKFILATAILALASCADNTYLGDQEEKTNAGGAISFGFDVPTPTRASGKDAATALNNQFIVYGEKDANDTETNAAPADGYLVFPNYQVNYVENSAGTTLSNTHSWEYVGYKYQGNTSPTLDYPVANITMKDGTNEPITANSGAQTIKYWDNNAKRYVFTAVSALPANISDGRVKIQKNLSGTTAYDKGYTITLTKNTSNEYPSLENLYFSDRKVIEKNTGYSGQVEMTFRNVLSHVRVGIYETIPGYKISEIKFYKQDGTTEYTVGTGPATSHFGAECPNINLSNFEGELTVTYANGTNGPENSPIVNVTLKSGLTTNADLVLGSNFSTLTATGTPTFLGESSTSATYDTDGVNNYTAVMPQAASTNLKLKVNYTLYNEITKETINITGKTAEIPAKYLDWKSNYKYTYLFKITDDGLNPITFDAVTVETANGTQETITTVPNGDTEPSITTYAKASNVITDGEYKDGATIYSTVMDGSSLATLDGTNFKLYTVTTEDANNFPITEASALDAILEYTTLNAAQATAAKINFSAITTGITYGKTVLGPDGSTVTLDNTNNVVASFIGAKSGTSPNFTATYYAIVYQKTAATYTYDEGKNDYTDGANGTFTAAGTLYTRTGAGTTESPYVYEVASSWTSGTTYYKRTSVATKGTYGVKIVKVVP